MNYCRDIWGFLSAEMKISLNKLLSFGAKIIFMKSKYDHSSHLIESLKFLSPEKKTSTYFLCCTAFKCINGLNNSNVSKIFELNISKSSTRNNIIIPRAKTNYMYCTILHRSSKMWIQIPENIRNIKTFEKFKITIKNELLNNRL